MADGHNCPIVILAVPRSGSQLLREFFNSHRDTLVAAYSDVLDEIGRRGMPPEEITALLHAEMAETRRTPADFAEFLRAVHRAFWTTTSEAKALGKVDVKHWGFVSYGMPGADGFLSLNELFPSARFVHIVRDGRNVVASFLANWSVAAAFMPLTRPDPLAVARLWVHWVRASQSYRPLTVRLEDLHEPSSQSVAVAKVRAHCSLAADPQSDAWVQTMPWVNSQRQTLDRWRQDLSASVVDALAGVDGFTDTLKAFGYV